MRWDKTRDPTKTKTPALGRGFVLKGGSNPAIYILMVVDT
jgi:hypothetical protein